MKPVGISILTNGNRLEPLKTCISSFLENCYYRPLVIGVYDNGSSDDTADWLGDLPAMYGVEWRWESSMRDTGCAEGTNKSIELVGDCDLALHLESDFHHMDERFTGENPMWLHRAVSFMARNDCDYMYLRRMMNEQDIYRHWWDKWWNSYEVHGRYLKPSNGFWWSNNPALFKPKALLNCGTLPLHVDRDGVKGTTGWSVPEMTAPKPANAWVHHWGLFVHELWTYTGKYENLLGGDDCLGRTGASKCKYGFFKSGDATDPFCAACRRDAGIDDMSRHARSVNMVNQVAGNV